MQESRLFRIVYYLLENGKATAPELAQKFEVSIRTIYRDIDAISSAGIPIYAAQGKGGGISILSDYTLEKSFFSEQEREQILMALQGIMATTGKTSDELLTKLSGLFQMKFTKWIEVDFSDWVQGKPQQNTFVLIKNAIFQKKVISFCYFNSKGNNSKRNALPICLVFKSKDWYLYAFCLLRNDYRFFKLTRIRQVEMLSDTFIGVSIQLLNRDCLALPTGSATACKSIQDTVHISKDCIQKPIQGFSCEGLTVIVHEFTVLPGSPLIGSIINDDLIHIITFDLLIKNITKNLICGIRSQTDDFIHGFFKKWNQLLLGGFFLFTWLLAFFLLQLFHHRCLLFFTLTQSSQSVCYEQKTEDY